MSLIITLKGSFNCNLSKSDSINEHFFTKTGINHERIKIIQNTESIKLGCFKITFKSLKGCCFAKTGNDSNSIKIIQNTEFINFDTMEYVNDTDVVFCVVLEKDFKDLDVKLPNKTVMLKAMSKHRTINDIKKWIYEKADMSLKDIKLLYNDKVLNDTDIIWNIFGKEKCPRITVSVEITVYVTCQRSGLKNEIVKVKVWTTDRVWLLKEAIDNKCSFDITSCDRLLTFCDEYLDNDTRLMDYGIKDGSMLEANYYDTPGPVGEIIKISVIYGNNYTVPLYVGRGDTVGRVKKLYGNKNGVRESELRFRYKNEELSNERTLADYDINNSDTITAIFKLRGGGSCPIIKRSVYGPNKQRFTVEINDMDTIGGIRESIETEEGYQRNEYDLIVDGRILNDNTIYKWWMRQLRLVEKRRVEVTFDIIENEVITGIPWQPNMNISDIKRIITNECGLFEHLQQLSINGVPREDNDTIASIMPGQSGDIIITCGIRFPDGQ